MIELGPGRAATPVELPDGSPAGYRVTHPRPDTGEPCYADGYWIPTIADELPPVSFPRVYCDSSSER